MAAWPEGGCAPLGTRERLIAAAGHLRRANLPAASAVLAPARPTPAEKAAAQRFFAKNQDLRLRFSAAGRAAQEREAAGANVAVVRDTLSRALIAGADEQRPAAAAQIEAAEEALDHLTMGRNIGPTGKNAAAVAALAREIGPAFRLGQELMTETHAVVETLVSRASIRSDSEEYEDAAVLLDLTARILGVRARVSASTAVPRWFSCPVLTAPGTVREGQARTAVERCEAMARSDPPAKSVTTLIQKARRELDAGRSAEAHWWASIVLAMLEVVDEGGAR